MAAAEVAVGLHVSDHGLDRRATPQFALDDAEDAALLTRERVSIERAGHTLRKPGIFDWYTAEPIGSIVVAIRYQTVGGLTERVMVRLHDLPKALQQQLRDERRKRSAHARAVVDACARGDAEQFCELTYPYDDRPDFWPLAIRFITRRISEVSPEIQEAFRQVWIETKMLGLRIHDHGALCQALRILTPKYHGPALRLFRAASARERQRRAYGISWTSSLEAAQRFAETSGNWSAVSVVLETVAPPEAIISVMEYPPLTEAERAEFGLPPTAEVVEWHDECEYLVDRHLLGPVKLHTRFAQRRRPL